MWMDLLQLGVSLNKTKVMNARKGLIRKRGGNKAGREIPENVG